MSVLLWTPQRSTSPESSFQSVLRGAGLMFSPQIIYLSLIVKQLLVDFTWIWVSAIIINLSIHTQSV